MLMIMVAASGDNVIAIAGIPVVLMIPTIGVATIVVGVAAAYHPTPVVRLKTKRGNDRAAQPANIIVEVCGLRSSISRIEFATVVLVTAVTRLLGLWAFVQYRTRPFGNIGRCCQPPTVDSNCGMALA